MFVLAPNGICIFPLFSNSFVCFSMSSNYNSRLKPAEVLISKREIRLIRKREEFKDLLKNQL